MKAAGKGVIGMKILGAGKLRNKVDESLQIASRSTASTASPPARNPARNAGFSQEDPGSQRAGVER